MLPPAPHKDALVDSLDHIHGLADVLQCMGIVDEQAFIDACFTKAK